MAQCSRSEIASETPSETLSGLSGTKSEGFLSPFIQCLENEECCVSIGNYHINQLSPARVRAGFGMFSHWGGRKMLRVERSSVFKMKGVVFLLVNTI